MKIKVRKSGTSWVIFEGEVKNTVFPEGTLNLMWFNAQTVEGQTEVELSVRDYVYPRMVDNILRLYEVTSKSEASVFQALDNMRENGYTQQPSALAEANALIYEVADLGECDSVQLVNHVNRWRTINDWKVYDGR